MRRPGPRIVRLGAPLVLLGLGLIASSCAVGAEDAATVDPPEAGAPPAPGPDGSVARDSGTDGGPDASAVGVPGDDGATGPGPAEDASGDDGDDGATDSDAGEDGGGVSDAGDAGDAGRKDGGEDAGIVDSGNEHDAADAASKDAGSTTEDGGQDAGDADATADACGPIPLFLVINEIQTSGTGGADDEWIEIFNPLACPVDISGWELRHTSISGTTIDKVFTATAGTVIAGAGYGVVAGTSYSASAPTIGTLSSGVLADTGGGLGLYDASGTIIDSMGYGAGATNPFVETAPAPAEGMSQSIARIPNGAETGDNAIDFKAASPTPGAEN